MSNITTTTNISPEVIDTNHTPQPLINSHNFESLQAMQRRISENTGISPSIRVIINLLINKEQLDHVETHLTQQLLTLNN